MRHGKADAVVLRALVRYVLPCLRKVPRVFVLVSSLVCDGDCVVRAATMASILICRAIGSSHPLQMLATFSRNWLTFMITHVGAQQLRANFIGASLSTNCIAWPCARALEEGEEGMIVRRCTVRLGSTIAGGLGWAAWDTSSQMDLRSLQHNTQYFSILCLSIMGSNQNMLQSKSCPKMKEIWFAREIGHMKN